MVPEPVEGWFLSSVAFPPASGRELVEMSKGVPEPVEGRVYKCEKG